MRKPVYFGSVFLCALALGPLGCERDPGKDTDVKSPTPVAERAPATQPAPVDPRNLEPAKSAREASGRFGTVAGLKLHGEAEFEETSDGVEVEVEIEDAPVGKKGLHIHEKGDCSDIAGKSMGEHFSPDRHEHGLPESEQRHLGDLGNITVESNGEGKLKMVVRGANLRPEDTHSFLGKAIVIHETADQGPGDPSGKSGKPIACAVIQTEH